ncbi:peptidase inhibitor family I36 protein [Actinosynnema sp. NPDC059797]
MYRKTVGALGFVGGLLAALVVQAPAASAAGTCEFTNTLCAWEQANFGGARFTVAPLPPHQGVCVDLVEHGWGNRIRSTVNTSSKTASLFASDDCTGRPFPIEGNSSNPSVTFAANSVFVQV